ncbi:MAG TPA: T9SS type A sorting domain-containing protein [Bacteroidia bacterium]|nr:T9SS type A sorting domain-containing protein [Bacteroidia bacterium]
MKTKLLAAVLIWFCVFGNTVFAQKENYVWYFGDHAGLDFNSGSPVALTNGMLNTNEGCSSISDANGNLLFYTDGIKVWDRNHNQMPNGDSLAGHLSSTQSALIVPFPGSDSLYYIFTTYAYPFPVIDEPFTYSVVDMSLNNSNGDITIKNNLLLNQAAEKLAGVKHSNGIDTWVVVTGVDCDTIYSYLVTAGGLSSNPVKNNSGWVFSGGDAAGYMKISPDGSKLACAGAQYDYAVVFDFDPSTGFITNPVIFSYPFWAHPYGIEFSKSGHYLYGTCGGGTHYLFQWDVIGDSLIIQIPVSTTSKGALQMGPDGKIYLAKNSQELGVINNPELPGIQCNYVDSAFYLSGKNSRLGLPDFISSYFLTAGINTNNPPLNQLTISPNPATDKIYISFPATTSENITTKIYSITGEVVYEQINKSAAPITKFQIPVFNISNGIYFLSVRTGREVVTRKIVVNH